MTTDTTTQTHTKGPWIVDPWRSNVTRTLRIGQPPNATGPRLRTIGSIPWADEGPTITGPDLARATAANAVALANAHLMAASPEMLHLLHTILAEHEAAFAADGSWPPLSNLRLAQIREIVDQATVEAR